MVGGEVVGIVRYIGEPTLLTVGGVREEKGQRLCVRVNEGADPIRVGDKVWWQSRWLMWTPQPFDGREDVRLERVGFSHTPSGESD